MPFCSAELREGEKANHIDKDSEQGRRLKMAACSHFTDSTMLVEKNADDTHDLPVLCCK